MENSPNMIFSRLLYLARSTVALASLQRTYSNAQETTRCDDLCGLDCLSPPFRLDVAYDYTTTTTTTIAAFCFSPFSLFRSSTFLKTMAPVYSSTASDESPTGKVAKLLTQITSDRHDKVLPALFEFHALTKDEIKQARLLGAEFIILSAMKKYDSNISIQCEGCSILNILVKNAKGSVIAILGNGGLDVIVNAMNSFEGDIFCEEHDTCLTILYRLFATLGDENGDELRQGLVAYNATRFIFDLDGVKVMGKMMEMSGHIPIDTFRLLHCLSRKKEFHKELKSFALAAVASLFPLP